MSDTPTARPELSPLLRMTETRRGLLIAMRGVKFDGEALQHAVDAIVECIDELDAQRAALAVAQSELGRVMVQQNQNATVAVLENERANKAEAALERTQAENSRLVEAKDILREQFETLRVDMGWTPSEQASEIRRLTNTLNDAGVQLAHDRAALAKAREALAAFREAGLNAFGDPEDCEDCATIADSGEGDGCRLHMDTAVATGLFRAVEAGEDLLGPCPCGHTRKQHDDEYERRCVQTGCSCRSFTLPASASPATREGQ
jgi:hypothetical protein